MEKKIVGFRKVEYTNKQGKQVSGLEVHYENVFAPMEADSNVSGKTYGSQWVKHEVAQKICEYHKAQSLIGLSGDFIFDQWKNVIGFMKF